MNNSQVITSRHLVSDEEMDEGEGSESESSSSLPGNQEAYPGLAQSQVMEAIEAEEQEERVEAQRRTVSFLEGREPQTPFAGKAPLWTDDQLVEESPDLADYFSEFQGISEVSQIAICRTYANYLAAKQKRLKPPTKRQKK